MKTSLSSIAQRAADSLLKGIALALSVAMLWLCIRPTAPAYAQDTVLTPRQVAEYALTLEKLEADFYRRAVTAAQSGGLASAPQIAKDAIVSYGQDEAVHVRDLSAILPALGGDPNAVTIPANPNYSAILGRDPFANPADFLLAGQYVEDLGVAAYKGQVQNLQAAGEAGKTVLAAALAIHSVEARHAAGVRFLRNALLDADVNPWISENASSTEVIYNENRTGSPIPFSSAAFDGYATQDEVLALVGPILTVAEQPTTSPSNQPASSDAEDSEDIESEDSDSEDSESSSPRALW
ncbi:ferritin-like domain-containing protein [Romeria aff. gracilis LEGE 07310]|uniref:Ferritin-like domain-containing protein n=1 Tax=Vasconcelosia minhoensis LEGE 07310 TaxID=915328 RepID=A0A8J7AWP7_9CYAN|nr:ferritin-like domain-containing protein [Romeria gracilis]MBE9078663.1 ferritin-like domain-containing protein [Romeria aff. gracilis LEGE 07310]